LYPLIPLGRRLAQEGADVRFITGATKVGLLSSLGFRAAPVLVGRELEISAYSDPARPVGKHPTSLLQQLRSGLRLLAAQKPEIVRLIETDRPDIVIADWITILPGVICEERNIPYITSVPAPLAIETRNGTPSFLGGWGEAHTALEQARDWLGRWVIRSAKRAAFALCAAETHALGLSGPYRADGSEVILSPRSIVGLGVSELEFARDWPPQFRMIGPVVETPEARTGTRLRWPDGRRKILLTVGTHLPWVKYDLVASARRLLEAFPDVLFCLSLGHAEQLAADPVQVGANWAVYEYIPYSSELREFDVVIHHGGAGVTYACLAAGKPCLVTPRDFDQFDYARRIEAKGLGRMISTLASRRAVSALQDLMHPRWQARLARMSAAVARYRPADAIVSEVVRVLDGR
jgi:UDP:flavonoid glycosyltransferase YjiC (YdhE family)